MYLNNEGETNDLRVLSDRDILKEYIMSKKMEMNLNDELKRLISSKENDLYSMSSIEEQIKDNKSELGKIKNELFRRSLDDKVKEIDKKYKEKLSDVDRD